MIIDRYTRKLIYLFWKNYTEGGLRKFGYKETYFILLDKRDIFTVLNKVNAKFLKRLLNEVHKLWEAGLLRWFHFLSVNTSAENKRKICQNRRPSSRPLSPVPGKPFVTAFPKLIADLSTQRNIVQ